MATCVTLNNRLVTWHLTVAAFEIQRVVWSSRQASRLLLQLQNFTIAWHWILRMPRKSYLGQSLHEDAPLTVSIEAEKLPHLQEQGNGGIDTG